MITENPNNVIPMEDMSNKLFLLIHGKATIMLNNYKKFADLGAGDSFGES